MKRLFLALMLLWPICASAQTVATASAVEASHIICATVPCETFGGQVNNTTSSSLWVMVFDANTVPADGTVVGCATSATARPCVIKWYQIGANSTIGVSELYIQQPYPFQSGLVVVCSSTGPFTKTASANCTFAWEIQK